jgi:putrescine transport system permease protein
MGEFVIPDLLGGPDTLMLGKLMWTEFFSNKDWPLASALAAVLLVVLIIPFMLLRHYEQRNQEAAA